jgi:hypothetical protein
MKFDNNNFIYLLLNQNIFAKAWNEASLVERLINVVDFLPQK